MIEQAWKDRILKPLLEGKPLKDEREIVYLVSADVNQAQRFVFESSRLPDIRGASRALVILGEAAQDFPNLPAITERCDSILQAIGLSVPSEIIYLGGGGLLALVDTEASAENLAQSLRRLYPQETGVVTASVVYQSFSLGQIQSNFAACLQRLQALLRIEKNSNQRLPFYERLPFVQTCFSCGTRPAVVLDPAQKMLGNDYPLCHICMKKVLHGNENWGGRERSLWAKRLFGNVDTANDLSEIGADSRDQIALLYADGDGIGKWLFKSRSIKEFRERSSRLRKAIASALRSAFSIIPLSERVTEDKRKEKFLPFEIVMVGGDDVLAFVPANRCFELAEKLVSSFSQEIGERDISLSVGLALAKSSTPVNLLYNVAIDLLKNSAKRRRKHLEAKEAYIDFHDINREGLPNPTIQRYREGNQYRFARGSYTARPYSATDFNFLHQQIKQIPFSNSQLSNMVQEIKHGFEASQLYFLYQGARLNEKKRGLLRNYESAFKQHYGAGSNYQNIKLPWLQDKLSGEWISIFPDIYLLDRLEGKKQQGANDENKA